MADDSVRVLLVDDHDLLRRGIKTMLETESDIAIQEAMRRRILTTPT